MEDSERKKAIELLKEMRSENKTVDDKSGNQETHLNWMYKGPSELIDREEYLLGKAIDKNFEVLNNGGGSDIGRTGEQSNVPKRLLEKTDSLEQVDVAKKILEDPLYAIKQKEMEARKKLLNNPVKLKQIKQMLLERSKQNSSHKLKKKKLKQKKSEQDLNFLILKKLEKFTDKEKRKALSKVMKSDCDSSSTESSSSNNKKHKKLKLKRKRSYSSSDEYDSSSENSSEKLSKKKKRKNEINRKKQSKKNKESGSSSCSSDYERNKKSKSKTLSIKHFRKSVDSDSINEEVMKSQDKNLRNFKNSLVKNKKRDKREQNTDNRQSKRMHIDKRKRNKDKRNSFSEEESRFKKSYGLMVPDGSKREKSKREIPVQKYQKSTESKTKHVPLPKVKPLSDKEREEKLKEMMENARLRKEDREKNLANHRKKQSIEEESKIYDDDFMRRQMSHLTSQGTMADRIKCNINNIQRSKSSMDISFVRK